MDTDPSLSMDRNAGLRNLFSDFQDRKETKVPSEARSGRPF
jgi:hypothetical protein